MEKTFVTVKNVAASNRTEHITAGKECAYKYGIALYGIKCRSDKSETF